MQIGSIRSKIAVLGVLALATGVLSYATPASAAAFTVTETTDGNDSDTSDTSCDTDAGTPGDQCTLRAAIQQTNAIAGLDTINVPSGHYILDQDGSFESAQITDALIIAGAGASTTQISPDLVGRVLDVGATGFLDLRDVEVSGGYLAADGAGILNAGELVLRRVHVTNNTAFGEDGGGLAATTTATATRIFDSVIGTPEEPNFALTAGADTPGGRGGGMAITGGLLEIRRSVIEANEANEDTVQNINGAGILIDFTGQPASIIDSVIRGNSANVGNGGGIAYIDYSGTNESLLITGTSIVENQASTAGGGLFLSGTSITIHNSTISGNGAASNTGALLGYGTIGIRYSTIAGNTAPLTPGLSQLSGTLTLTGTIHDNPDENCYDGGGVGSIVSGGSNIDSGSTCGFEAAASNLDPLLSPLADNGGRTPTHLLGGGSPAINRGTICGGTDQRGAPRAGKCDAGAYERISCSGVLVDVIGTAGADRLVGTSGRDGILGLGGNDRIAGAGGIDGLCGGAGKDTLNGGVGKDRLVGGGSGDVLKGAGGRDMLAGNAGGDRLTAGGGNDRLLGHGGRDVLLAGAGRDRLDGGPKRDRCDGGGGRDRGRRCERNRRIP